jgi:hypothetical protein
VGPRHSLTGCGKSLLHRIFVLCFFNEFLPFFPTCTFSFLLSSSLLSKNVKIKIYRNIILPVVLYGCESWSLTLREESRFSRIKC